MPLLPPWPFVAASSLADRRWRRRYTASQLALRYGFPVVTKPTERYVAIIELTSKGTPTGWSENDFKAYCGQASTGPARIRRAWEAYATQGVGVTGMLSLRWLSLVSIRPSSSRLWCCCDQHKQP